MEMKTDAQKNYENLLLEIGGLLREKNETISLRDYQLKEVRKQVDYLLEEKNKVEAENAELLEALRSAEKEIEHLKGVQEMPIEDLKKSYGGDDVC